MNVHEAIRTRRSIRDYQARPVDPEMLVRLVEAGCWAPSAGNMQNWRFILVRDPSRLRKLRMVSPGMIGVAPAAIVVCEDVEATRKIAGDVEADRCTKMDAALAAYAICLEAHELGLGTCMVGSFHTAAVQKLLKLPKGTVPMLIVAVGYPSGDRKAPQRNLENIYSFEVYSEDG